MFQRTILLAATFFLAACGQKKNEDSQPDTIRVGYFPNVTHSQAMIGLARGDFQKALGSGTRIDARPFNAGPSVIEAMFAGELDLAYIGPNPAINGFVQSKGEVLRIVAGATSGGAALVVRPRSGIRSGADLARRKIASPQLGNTQDVALRNYLLQNGHLAKEKGGTVEIIPTANPQILDLFRLDQIDGAWVPEPWASRLVFEGGGEVLIDERELWANGDFVTAHVIVSTSFLRKAPSLVEAWLSVHVEVTQWELEHPNEARELLNTEIGRITGKKLPERVMIDSWNRLRPTWDPIQHSLYRSAESAFNAGFLRTRPNLTGIYDLKILNSILRARNLPPIAEVEP